MKSPLPRLFRLAFAASLAVAAAVGPLCSLAQPCSFTVAAQGPGSLVAPGQTINLSVSGAPAGATYAWVGPNGFSATVATPSITNAQFVNSGTYSVGVTSEGCTSTSSVEVNVGPAWNWARRAGGVASEGVGSMCRDTGGNLYVTGWFAGSAPFGATTLSSGGNADVFVAKLDAAGNWLWAVRAGGGGSDAALGIGVDGSGNVYVTGQAGANAAFGATVLTGGMFVAKLDGSGNWLWATQATGTAPVLESTTLSVDGSGNAYVTGRFGDPNAAATGATAIFGTTTLTNLGRTDAFAAKISTAGAWQWARAAGSTGLDGGTGVAVDATGNALLTGYFTSTTAAFGSLTATGSSATRDNLYVARLSATGSWQWVRHVATTTGNGGSSVAVDATGVGYVLGGYAGGPATFGSTTLSGGSMFVGRISMSGTWLRATSASVSRGGTQGGNLITVDAARNVYVTGHFFQTSTFGTTTLVRNYHHEPNVFLAKLSSTGAWQWATVAGGYTVGDNLGVAEAGGNVSIAGAFYGPTATFSNVVLNNAGANVGYISGDVFVASIGGGPVVSGFSPASGLTGTSVSITGSSFNNVAAVTFGGMAATSFTVNSSTSITATVPANALTGKVGVSAGGGSALSAASFKVLPTFTAFTPASGAPGAVVTLTGTGLMGTTAVKFNGVAATSFTVVNGTTVQATVPALAKTGKISLTTAGGTVTSAATFAVAPTISSFTPGSGSPGSVVVVTGLNFVSGTTASFNGTAATTTYNSATQLTAVVPGGATTGPLTVTNANGTGTSAASFTVTATPAPTITGMSPMTGPVGTVVNLTGSNFTGVTAVRLGTVAVTTYTVNSATSLTATVPVGAVTGRFYVEAAGGMAQSAVFAVMQPPTITSFSPSVGPEGTVVTINGTNFGGTSSVTFGGVAATTFTVNSSMKITATVPVGALTGTIGVTTPAGTTASANSFTVTTLRPGAPEAGAALTVYPNPASGRVRISGPAGALVEVRNPQGRVVRTAHLAPHLATTLDLDLSGLPSGIYAVRVGTATRRLVVE